MLAVGDKVVYPMHGAGVIEAIEEHEIMGQRQSYYILTMPYGAMRVMIPTNNVDTIGIRSIISETEVEEVASVLQGGTVDVSANWNRRFNNHLSKIKTGSIYEVAEVVRNLTRQDNVKKLSTGERKLLDTAKNILVSELVLACGKDSDSVADWVNTLSMNIGEAF